MKKTVSYMSEPLPEGQPTKKPWYMSRTLWLVAIMSTAEIVLLATQMLPLNETTIATLLFLNKALAVILRFLTQSKLTT